MSADKVFCPFWQICRDGADVETGEKCGRALTDKVRKKFNTGNTDISIYHQHPECFVEESCEI
jgi:hypothetical protein